MGSHLGHGGLRVSTTGILLVLNKLLVMCMAWLFFFFLVLVGWDLSAQQEQPLQSNPYETYEPAAHITLKGGIEK